MTEPRAPEVVPPPPPPGPPGQPPLPSDGIPKASVARRKRRQISLVWVIPAIAVMIGIWLVINTVRTQGPTIDIQFKTAEGLEAGKTRIKYKNVDIGTVQSITLGQERKGVVVTAKMTRAATDLLVEDTRFWIVKPRIAGGQISGLTTLLSGSYIGMDIGKSPESKREFVGLDTQPSVTTDEPGREFLLRAADSGSLDIGTPVFFRRFDVGQVTAVTLDADGKGITARVFIRSPYERYVTQNTRFWEASGLDVSIGASGVKVATQSLASVIIGGIAFQTPLEEPPGAASADGAAFTLFTNEQLAMKRSEAQLEKYVTYFTDSIRGLSVGAPVEFRGYVVGEVRSIEMTFDRTSREFRFPVEFVLYRDVLPARIARAERNGAPVDQEAAYARAIEKRGLRAQLRSGNLLTGTKLLAVDFFKDARPVDMASTRDEAGNRIIPSIPGTFEELQETLASIAKKIEKIPFEQLANELRRTLQQVQTSLKGADKLVTSLDRDLAPEVVATLGEVRRTVKNANEVLASDAPVQQDLRSTLNELSRAAVSLRYLTDYLQRHPESLLRGKATDAPPSTTYVAPVAPPAPVENAK